jgi:hypothetical protein
MSALMRLLALGLALALPASATASGQCTIVGDLPVLIDQPGNYCLDADHSITSLPSGTVAIDIRGNGVTLDCRGHALRGDDADAGALRGRAIVASNANNLTLRNCTVRGVPGGITVGTRGAVFVPPTGVRIENNQVIGASMDIYADGAVVRGNLVKDVRDKTVGIRARGNVDILDNTVDGVSHDSYAVAGIAHDDPNGSVIEGNRVRNLSSPSGGVGIQTSSFEGVTAVVIRNNILVYGGDMLGTAIWCRPDGDARGEVAEGNLWFGFKNGVSNCVDGGGNRTAPSAPPPRQVGGEHSKRARSSGTGMQGTSR